MERQGVDLKKFLKFRLKKWKNKEYWLWQSSHRVEGYEWHHLLGKQYTDLFVVNILKTDHDRIHSPGGGYKEGEFEELFIESVNNIQKFIDDRTIRSG